MIQLSLRKNRWIVHYRWGRYLIPPTLAYNFQSIFIIRNKIVVFRTKQFVLKIFDIHFRSLTRKSHYWQVYNALSVQFLTVLGKFSVYRPKSLIGQNAKFLPQLNLFLNDISIALIAFILYLPALYFENDFTTRLIASLTTENSFKNTAFLSLMNNIMHSPAGLPYFFLLTERYPLWAGYWNNPIWKSR